MMAGKPKTLSTRMRFLAFLFFLLIILVPVLVTYAFFPAALSAMATFLALTNPLAAILVPLVLIGFIGALVAGLLLAIVRRSYLSSPIAKKEKQQKPVENQSLLERKEEVPSPPQPAQPVSPQSTDLKSQTLVPASSDQNSSADPAEAKDRHEEKSLPISPPSSSPSLPVVEPAAPPSGDYLQGLTPEGHETPGKTPEEEDEAETAKLQACLKSVEELLKGSTPDKHKLASNQILEALAAYSGSLDDPIYLTLLNKQIEVNRAFPLGEIAVQCIKVIAEERKNSGREATPKSQIATQMLALVQDRKEADQCVINLIDKVMAFPRDESSKQGYLFFQNLASQLVPSNEPLKQLYQTFSDAVNKSDFVTAQNAMKLIGDTLRARAGLDVDDAKPQDKASSASLLLPSTQMTPVRQPSSVESDDLGLERSQRRPQSSGGGGGD